MTLALDARLRWPQKLRYFQHALRRHCNPPNLAEEPVWLFYRELAHFVREHCGREALLLASAEDDRYAERLKAGRTPEQVAMDARPFFHQLLEDAVRCPEHFTDDDWMQLRILRDQWVPPEPDPPPPDPRGVPRARGRRTCRCKGAAKGIRHGGASLVDARAVGGTRSGVTGAARSGGRGLLRPPASFVHPAVGGRERGHRKGPRRLVRRRTPQASARTGRDVIRIPLDPRAGGSS